MTIAAAMDDLSSCAPRFDFEFWAERETGIRNNAPVTINSVCRFWLKGLCMAGSACKYHHVYIDARVPLCKTVGTGVACSGPCPFRHL